MAQQLQIQFIKGRKIPLARSVLYGICAVLIIFFVGKTIVNHEAVTDSPNSAIFSELRYVGYLQTSTSLLGLIKTQNHPLISVRVGMHLLDCVIQQISPQQIQLLAKNGEIFFIKFAGAK